MLLTMRSARRLFFVLSVLLLLALVSPAISQTPQTPSSAPPPSYLTDYTVHLFERQTARFQDLDSLRRELIEQINEVRTEKGLHPLTGDPTLDLAAQDYADDLFQGIKQGKNGPASGIPLTRRVVLRHYHPEGASGVGQAVVHGALSPEVTLAALLGNRIGGRSEVLGKGYQQIGIGLAFERKGDTFDVVWVQCLARPAPKS